MHAFILCVSHEQAAEHFNPLTPPPRWPGSSKFTPLAWEGQSEELHMHVVWVCVPLDVEFAEEPGQFRNLVCPQQGRWASLTNHLFSEENCPQPVTKCPLPPFLLVSMANCPRPVTKCPQPPKNWAFFSGKLPSFSDKMAHPPILLFPWQTAPVQWKNAPLPPFLLVSVANCPRPVTEWLSHQNCEPFCL